MHCSHFIFRVEKDFTNSSLLGLSGTRSFTEFPSLPWTCYPQEYLFDIIKFPQKGFLDKNQVAPSLYLCLVPPPTLLQCPAHSSLPTTPCIRFFSLSSSSRPRPPNKLGTVVYLFMPTCDAFLQSEQATWEQTACLLEHSSTDCWRCPAVRHGYPRGDNTM